MGLSTGGECCEAVGDFAELEPDCARPSRSVASEAEAFICGEFDLLVPRLGFLGCELRVFGSGEPNTSRVRLRFVGVTYERVEDWECTIERGGEGVGGSPIDRGRSWFYVEEGHADRINGGAGV